MTVDNETPVAEEVPLVTDLDGTLIKADLLVVAAKQLLKKNFLYLPLLFFWLLKGKADLKKRIFERVKVDLTTLPFNTEVREFLKSEFARGRNIVLATASPEKEANEIAALFPVFSAVIGTKDNVNLKGANKRDRLVASYGTKGFDYIGDADADLVIFESCRLAYLVNPSEMLKKKAAQVATVKQIWTN